MKIVLCLDILFAGICSETIKQPIFLSNHASFKVKYKGQAMCTKNINLSMWDLCLIAQWGGSLPGNR